jgi:pimeloyl-ACP methyl ester carboxylesterase
MMEGTGRIADLCTLEITIQRRTSAYHRTDPACPGENGPLVVFIGGFADGLNHNVVRIFCAYDERWERTRKLYLSHDDALERMRSLVVERAAGAPVVLVGHSLGGDAAYRLAEALRDDADVRLLVTLDPVSSHWQGREAPRPAGVDRWINVRVGSRPGLTSCGLAGTIGGAWGPQPAADADLRFPPDPAKDDPDDDHCKTEQMFLLDEVQAALAAAR